MPPSPAGGSTHVTLTSDVKKTILISVDLSELRVAVVEEGRGRGLSRAPRAPLDRRQHLPRHRRQRAARHGGGVRRDRAWRRTASSTSTRSSARSWRGRRGARKIQDLIQRGQTVLVQAVKDPMKTKGAAPDDRDLAARTLRRLRPARRRARRLAPPRRRRAQPPEGNRQGDRSAEAGGVIVRTAAEGASAEDVARDLDFLRRLWSRSRRARRRRRPGRLIYQEAELPLRVTRDLFTGDFERLLVDHDRRLQAHRRLPEEDLAAHGRARHAATRSASRCSRPSASSRRSARPSTAASICLPAAT